MSRVQEICTRALSLLGEEENGQVQGLESLCACAEAELAAQLKAGTSPEDCGESFLTAGALLALELYGSAQEAAGITSFRAGEVSYSRNGGKPGSLRAQAYSLLRPWLAGTPDFAFRGVRG